MHEINLLCITKINIDQSVDLISILTESKTLKSQDPDYIPASG